MADLAARVLAGTALATGERVALNRLLHAIDAARRTTPDGSVNLQAAAWTAVAANYDALSPASPSTPEV